MRDRYTNQPRGFGFVTYADPSVVDKVIEDTHIINGKQVRTSLLSHLVFYMWLFFEPPTKTFLLICFSLSLAGPLAGQGCWMMASYLGLLLNN